MKRVNGLSVFLGLLLTFFLIPCLAEEAISDIEPGKDAYMNMVGPDGRSIREQLGGLKEMMQQGRGEISVDDLPYPVYPGAKVVSGMAGAVVLVTGDDLGKVDAFYWQKLEGKGMVRKEIMGITAYIPEKMDTPEYTVGSTPGVMYSAGGEDLEPDAKTRIDMTY